MTRIAIVVVTFNSAREIGGCLDALSPLADVEVLVVDNASTDLTRQEVTRRGVALIANRTNAGFAAAVNQGVRATTSPLILLLNPDAHLIGGLESLAARCETAGTGGAGGLLLGPDRQPQSGFMARNLPTAGTLILEVLGINKLWPGNPVNWHYRCKNLNPMTGAPVDQPAGAFFMFPRSAWKTVGGFDERFTPIWFEDVDFCARLKSAGLQAYYEPLAVAKHAGAHSIHALSLENRERYWYGSLLEYAAKHFSFHRYRMVCIAVAAGSFLRALWGFSREGVQALTIYGGVARMAAGRLFGSLRNGRAGLV